MKRISFGLIMLNLLLSMPAVPSTQTKTQSIERFASDKIGQTVSNSTVAGIWDGEWSNPEGYLFKFQARLTVNSGNNVSGAITWKLLASPRSNEQSKVGLSAIEYVGGTYNSENRLANISGQSKDDPRNIISLDEYKIVVAEDGQSITGKTANHGNWQGMISGKRVDPCGDEEIQTNYDPSNNGIVSGYHHYEVKTIICSLSDDCTVDKVFKFMESNAKYIAPVEYSKPVKTCMLSTVNIPVLGEGTILSVVDENSHSVTNFTKKDHPLHPGKVVRSVVEENKSVIVKTVGDGTGWFPSLNKSMATDLWRNIDNQLKDHFNSKVKEQNYKP
ncbi:MAG: hypothetical protein V7L22_33240 [Nostoc sp.]|uniref:hypothetical protein n=1 Tax=Nostoc sp. TaxID=1180 RepID=UPI002FF9AC06